MRSKAFLTLLRMESSQGSAQKKQRAAGAHKAKLFCILHFAANKFIFSYNANFEADAASGNQFYNQWVAKIIFYLEGSVTHEAIMDYFRQVHFQKMTGQKHSEWRPKCL